MPDILKTVNLFPYTQFWRINGEGNLTSTCGGAITLSLFACISVLLITQMMTVFKMQTITSNSQTLASTIPPLTTINTYQQNSTFLPFMFGMDINGGNPGVDMSQLSISAYVDNLSGENMSQSNQTIILQKCTPKHFSVFPNIQDIFQQWTTNDWLCLPLNNSYVIQGSHYLNGNYSSINILFNCTGQCMNNFNKNLNIWLYTLTTAINPTNNSHPIDYFLTQTNVPITSNLQQQFAMDLTQNILTTDSSLLYYPQTSTINSIQTGTFQNTQILDSDAESSTLFYFQRSPKTILTSRSYLQILDAISYVGGVFQGIIGVFFFVAIYGRNVFEFKFAMSYLKTNVAKHFGFISFIKLNIYRVLAKINVKLQWPAVENQVKLKQTVNHLLDVVYLQKRIELLERAITIVLEKHQVKGLYLYHSHTKELADKNYRDHKFRERMVYFLNDKRKQRLENQQPEEKQMKNPIYNKDSQKQLIQQFFSFKNYQKNVVTMNKQSLTKRPLTLKDIVERQFGKSVQKDSSKNIVLSQSLEAIKHMDDHMNSNTKMSEENHMESSNKFSRQDDIKHREYSPDQIKLKELQQKLDHEHIIKQEMNLLTYFNKDDLKVDELIYQLDHDLRKLVEEGEAQGGDIRSKRIYQSIDGWMKKELKIALMQNYKAQQIQMMAGLVMHQP